jgi:succinate dehydrogenase / fumarate reductase membrane anchor subunit
MENKRRSSWSWFWQAVTGLALLLLLGLHFVAHHFVAEGGIRDFPEVIQYLSNPIIIVLELAFLVVVTWHALLGVRSILFDLGLSARTERMVSYGMVVIGVVTVLYGFWVMYSILTINASLTALVAR